MVLIETFKIYEANIIFCYRLQVVRCVNQIDEVCKDIEKTINQTIQNTLNALEKDCERIDTLIEQQIEDDNLAKAYNLRASGKGT